MCKKKYQIEIKYWNRYYYMNGDPVLNAYRNREISTNSLRYLHRKIEEYNEATPGVPLYFDMKTGKQIDNILEFYFIDYAIERYDSLEKNTRMPKERQTTQLPQAITQMFMASRIPNCKED